MSIPPAPAKNGTPAAEPAGMAAPPGGYGLRAVLTFLVHLFLVVLFLVVAARSMAARRSVLEAEERRIEEGRCGRSRRRWPRRRADDVAVRSLAVRRHPRAAALGPRRLVEVVSIVFIDEIDAIAGRRGEMHVHDGHVNQLLAEIDGVSGQRGVFVVGATNRPDQLDPALLRGGRLSRTIVLGLPDEAGRLAMLRLHTARMPTVAVRLAAMARTTAEGGAEREPVVMHDDFAEALARLRAGSLPETAS